MKFLISTQKSVYFFFLGLFRGSVIFLNIPNVLEKRSPGNTYTFTFTPFYSIHTLLCCLRLKFSHHFNIHMTPPGSKSVGTAIWKKWCESRCVYFSLLHHFFRLLCRHFSSWEWWCDCVFCLSGVVSARRCFIPPVRPSVRSVHAAFEYKSIWRGTWRTDLAVG